MSEITPQIPSKIETNEQLAILLSSFNHLANLGFGLRLEVGTRPPKCFVLEKQDMNVRVEPTSKRHASQRITYQTNLFTTEGFSIYPKDVFMHHSPGWIRSPEYVISAGGRGYDSDIRVREFGQLYMLFDESLEITIRSEWKQVL